MYKNLHLLCSHMQEYAFIMYSYARICIYYLFICNNLNLLCIHMQESPFILYSYARIYIYLCPHIKASTFIHVLICKNLHLFMHYYVRIYIYCCINLKIICIYSCFHEYKCTIRASPLP